MRTLTLYLSMILFTSLLLTNCTTNTKTEVKNIPGTIYGRWNVWIPGAVVYNTRPDNMVDMKYYPGAAMNTLIIQADGTYQWGEHSGTIKKATPWYAQDGISYYRVSDAKNNTYDFWYKNESDELIFLAGEVGGHVATGTRVD
jgi:hypothetical protein